MLVFASTDIGMSRNMNQDYYYISDDEELSIFILADGMGGYNGGEIASKIAVESARKFLEEKADDYKI